MGSLRVTERYGEVEAVTLYEALDHDGLPVDGPTIAVVGCVHGNEPVGRHTLARFAAAAADQLVAGAVVAVLANLEAMAADVRHTPDGADMNRMWDHARLAALRHADLSELCYEERRVRELAPILLGADGVLDLHSTSRPSPPHLIYRDDARHEELALAMGVRRLVTGVHEGAILDGGLCANVGLRPGLGGPRLGFTLEAGQHQNPQNVEHAWAVVQRLLGALGMWRGAPARPAEEVEVYEVIDRFRQAPAGTEPYRFAGWEGDLADAAPAASLRRLESFEWVAADEVVLRRGRREVVRAAAPFTMLMPAPTAGPGEDLYYVTQRRHDADAPRPRHDEAARTDALAMERMLDLMAVDEAQRGQLTVTFASRRTLDLCAEAVARTRRLPAGHPDRRLLVVGRGEWEQDEHEQRASQRYGQAMRDALAEGVRVDRVQLLRGASFDWLRQLAVEQQLGLDRGEGLRLWLSARQPHTVSLLLCGDAERALERGDLRNVFVAVVIEAATIEPDVGDVRTRIARAAVFGARRELVEAAVGLSRALQAEHALLLDGQLPDGDGLAGLPRASDGALCPRSPEEVRALRDALARLQHTRWRSLLAHEVTQARHLPDDAALGGWLARTMAATGILDGDALRRLLVVPADGGYRVEPDGLRAEPPDLDAWRPAGSRRKWPEQVLEARSVTRDTFARWVGWRRFLREAAHVPGAHGRDLSVVFDAAALQERVAGWLRAVVHDAGERPGRWQLVVAGDGLGPRHDGRVSSAAWSLLAAHRDAVRCGALQVVRIQHAQGGHVGWLKDLVNDLAARPPGSQPVELVWETEHGSTVNVVLIARYDGEGEPEPGTLEPWTIVRGAVLLSDLGLGGVQVGLLTEPGPGGAVNQELLQFGRAHCEGLRAQARVAVRGRAGPMMRVNLEAALMRVLTESAAALRGVALPAQGPGPRGVALARRAGLRDVAATDALAEALAAGASEVEAARDVLRDTPPWPGALWQELGRVADGG